MWISIIDKSIDKIYTLYILSISFVYMKTAIITLKTDPKVKKQAKKVASDLGFSLSAVLNGYLMNFIRNREIHFEDRAEEPSEYLKKAIREAEMERREGWVSPSFNNAKDAIDWLDNPNRKYVRDLQPDISEKN